MSNNQGLTYEVCLQIFGYEYVVTKQHVAVVVGVHLRCSDGIRWIQME